MFALNTVGLSYIASIQRGKCNALDCIENDLFYVVHQFFKAFSSCSLERTCIYIQYE